MHDCFSLEIVLQSLMPSGRSLARHIKTFDLELQVLVSLDGNWADGMMLKKAASMGWKWINSWECAVVTLQQARNMLKISMLPRKWTRNTSSAEHNAYLPFIRNIQWGVIQHSWPLRFSHSIEKWFFALTQALVGANVLLVVVAASLANALSVARGPPWNIR